MDVDALLEALRADPAYAGQIVHTHVIEPRAARFARPAVGLSPAAAAVLAQRGIGQLYTHQAEAIDHLRAGRDVVVVTGTASGKSLCYSLPIIESLARDPAARALLLFPTKALSQDQHRQFGEDLAAAGLGDRLAGVFDGDTPSNLRRKLRDRGSAVFSNPDMLHAALMPHHGRWADFLAHLKYVVLDELHLYNGLFGSNLANLMRRFHRLCDHYGSRPRFVACSATIANPRELAEGLLGRPVDLVDNDGAPRGRRTYVFWNPPRVRGGDYRSRRSANVEAHELMAELLGRGAGTITFSKAKMTAEMIHRYVTETLRETAPQLVSSVTPYRGGYLAAERREIERQLFTGQLRGVSTTRALELGIDVGALDACILVGYPGTRASFYQQAGRAGRRDRDAVAFLVALDTSINQYIMTHPEYLFDRAIEQAVIEPDNPFVVTGHLRCAAHEKPLADAEAEAFGPAAGMVLDVLAGNGKLRHLQGAWYHAAEETPQHEVTLRDTSDKTVTIEDADTGDVLGQVDKFDAPPILHPGAIYMHRGQTYRVKELDVEEKFLATVRKVEVDYYTQPIGGTDVHHIDHQLREKPFGTGTACWGEVTAYFQTHHYEKVHFYTLDAVSVHGVDLPTFSLETMAVWIVPPESLMRHLAEAGLDAHAGLRGLGYATRMLLPLFVTCDTLDFSHSVGSANSPWQATFIFERYPLGLGFTEKAYDRLDEILPAVLKAVEDCPCEAGCPVCVGKPLRPYSTWNVERGEGSIPSKAATRMILQGLLGESDKLAQPDTLALTDRAGQALRAERTLRRRLERLREPKVFHPIDPRPRTDYPAAKSEPELAGADVARRQRERIGFHREIRRRLAKKIASDELPADAGRQRPPEALRRPGKSLPPTAFPGKPAAGPTGQFTGGLPGRLPTAGSADPSAAPHGTGELPDPPGQQRQTGQGGQGEPAAPSAQPAEPAGPSGASAESASAGQPASPANPDPPAGAVRLGNDLAARARRLKKRKDTDEPPAAPT